MNHLLWNSIRLFFLSRRLFSSLAKPVIFIKVYLIGKKEPM
ncbi:hypothetical protein F385_1582 [Pantoea agglomerans 299R]|nr:hypothetical protein F385_1582 [Pantoea agglomerans 299R]